VGAGFYQQRPLVEQIWCRVIVVGLDVLRACGSDQRVHDRVERLSGFLVTEHQFADPLAIEVASLVEHASAELVDDGLQALRAGLHYLARQIVRVYYGDSELPEHLRYGRLPARDPTRQTHNRFHCTRVLNITSFGQDDSVCATQLRMRAVVQRVNEASVTVDGDVVGAIGRGLLVYLGAAQGDEAKDVQYTVDKIAGLRVYPNDEGRMSLTISDIDGVVLVVSQFTLFGDVRRGRRPSFDGAADPEDAERLYLEVVDGLRRKGLPVETGTFRAMMVVRSAVDGPVTIQIDSRKLY